MKNKITQLFLVLCFFSVQQMMSQISFGKVALTKVEESRRKTTDQSIFEAKIHPVTGTEFRLIKTETDKIGMKHRAYQQYYKGIKVHFGTLKIHEKNGLRETYGGAYFNPSEVNLNPSISVVEARNRAKTYIGSNDVFWIGTDDISKTKIPEPEILIFPNRRKRTMHLVYAIGIGASKPELKMGIVYIDAQTGEVIKYKNLISACFDSSHTEEKHANKETYNALTPLVSGTATTVYSGSQSIETTLDTDYILYDQTKANTGQGHNHGAGTRNGIVTVNFNNHDVINDYNDPNYVTDFTDNNNNWTAGEMGANEDQYALDAHWGAQVVYDYWKNEHGRDSYDGNDATIASYVHFDTDYTNAAWVSFNSQRGFMIYGDGGGSFTPLTNLDVVGHEIGHGVTSANSNLDYELESGALNEGMSDIWAAAIDIYATANHGITKSPWLINDENGGGTFRSMSNPNAYGQPDTYGGMYWYDVVGCTPVGGTSGNDYCGVHTNSGVLNYWFYLLVNGGSGTNDNTDSYSVSAIGIDKAAAIAYRMESLYLTDTSDYAAARAAAIQAAADLYGYCSSEEESVTDAWYAVGVGNAYSGSSPLVTTDTSDQTVCVGETAIFTAEADYANTMIWQNDASGSWADLSDDTTYSGVTTNTLTITNSQEVLDGVRFRLEFSNDCGTTSTTNNRYLYVKTLPDVTSVVASGAGCSSTTDGSLTVSFNDVSNLSNLEFSIDGGTTYPYNYADTSGSQTISGLTAGDYNVWVRRGGDDCPREVGTYTVITAPTVTATVDAVVEADIAEVDGIIQVSFSDEATQTDIKFSVDGGTSYPFVFDDSIGTGELTGLGSDTYDVWVAFGDESCQKSLGSFTVNEMAYTQIPDANFEAALNDLTYDNYPGDNKVPTSLINAITSLNVRLEGISSLSGIENFTALEDLYVDNNNLTSIDVSSNTTLKQLVAYNNPNLSSFTVADPSIITRVTLSNCNLSGNYDFSAYSALVNFSVQSNDLTGLNIKNSNNTNFTYFHAGGNSSLTCVIVDDAAYSTTNWTNNGGATYTSGYCNYTAVPDVNFENALEALGYDDISSDGQVPTALIEVIASLDVSNQSISDLTGIEDFTDLIDLTINDNTLTNLDVSNNGNLHTLNFDNNDVANLVLGTNTNLSEVSGRYNQLTSVDVSANAGLTNLNLRNNTFATVDVSNNTNLTVLNLNSTGITTIDITNNTNLSHVYLSDNSLTSLDISQNPLIENINLTNNDLTTIDVSNLTALRILRLSGNSLTALDLTSNVALTQVECADNELSSFNFKTGFNQIITDFDISGNASLTCILVDDLNKDYTFWIKDATASFSDTYCVYTAIPDANFEAALENLGYDDISGDGQVPTELIKVVTTLNVNNEGIADLTGIEDFIALTDLRCAQNSLSTLDLSNNLNLEALRCYTNPLTSLNITNNSQLSFLNCHTTSLTALDVTNNTVLKTLKFYDISGIGTIDLSQNLLLEELGCRNTGQTYLDLSLHTALVILDASDNSLENLNVKNGNNTNVTSFDASSNPSLTCILVDDLANDYSTWVKDATTNFNDTYCRYTAIPDANFEAALEALGYDDISGDGQVPTALIEVVTNLGVSQKSISDLTGIQDFTALTSLNCRTNNLTSIDLSNNLLLESFAAWSNNLTSLDVSGNTALEVLSIHYNNLTTIDVSNNPALRSLQLNNNDAITTVDVTNNPALEILKIYGLDLTTLDLSNNPALDQLVAYSTQITAFDFSNNPSLRILEVHNNAISSIDFSNNPLLESLRINQTQIEDLDLSLQTNLTFLRCFQTNLYNLNVQNGNNTNITKFDAWSNPNLTCILVDDAAYSSGNTIWADNVDSGVTFNDGTYCRYTSIPDANFEAALETLGLDDISGDGQVPTQLIEVLETLDVENKSISDLTGIEDFRALKTLDVGYNSLSTIDLTDNTELRQLIVRSNNLTTIDLSANVLLVGFKAESCSLTSLDITNNPNLKVLWITGNDLTTIDLSHNLALTSFWGNGNDFTTLDLTNNVALNSFRASSNSLTALDLRNGTNTNITGGTNFQLTGNADLTCVLVDDATYSTTNWLGINGLVSFSDTNCNYTSIPDVNFEARLEALGYDDISGDGKVPTRFIEVVTSLNVSNQDIADLTGIEDFTALQYLVSANNSSLATIDVSNNTNLLTLSAFNCGLTSLDVTSNASLQRLVVYGNTITNLDVSLNTQLIDLDLGANGLTALDVTNNVLLQTLFVEDNTISSLDLSRNAVLVELTCQNNSSLSYLNVKNGNNTNVTNFIANNIPSLACILVDDVAYSTTNWTSIDATTSFSTTYCRYTLIPDANFEAELRVLGYDDSASNDGQVPTTLIEVVTDLDVRNKSIADVTGIEDFTALETFNCNLNSITALDVSNNLNLTALQCTANPIETLDLANNTQLTGLNCRGTDITFLDVTNNTLLESIICFDTDIVTIDVSKNLLLEQLHCYSTNLTDLNLSLNTALTQLRVENCELVSLNIKNGNNTSITNFDASGNPNLSCIRVDDLVNDYTGWVKDATANFSDTYCNYTAIPDANFEARLGVLGYDDINSDGQVPTALIEAIVALNIENQGILDVTGIEDFTALENLFASGNSLTAIDVTQNANLRILDITDSSVTTLDVSQNPDLTDITANNNALSALDVSQNTNLNKIYVTGNNLTSIDLSSNLELTHLFLNDNNLSGIDVSLNTDLQFVNLSDNALTSLDTSNNPLLQYLDLRDNSLTYLNTKSGGSVTSYLFLYTANNLDLNCIAVDDITHANNAYSVDAHTSFNETSCDYVVVDIDVFLQGALLNPYTGEENLMRDDLRINGLINPDTPYTDGASINQLVGLNDNGNNSTVDWIWVELRDATDPTIVIAGQSGILQRDGDLVDVSDDLITPLTFNDVAAGNYYVVVKHRNHLGIMTANPIALNQAATNLDLTDANNPITYGTNAQTNYGMPDGVVAMWAGNASSDNTVKYQGGSNDTTFIKDEVLNDVANTSSSNLYIFTGYSEGDVNMDGTIQYQGSGNDSNVIKDIILSHTDNLTSPSNLFIITGQLPELIEEQLTNTMFNLSLIIN